MSKPILYKANESNFSHLGLGVLADEAGSLVTEERNGQFYLEMKYPVDGINFKELKNDRLIKASTSPNLKGQRFKIIRIGKPAKGLVDVYAEHVSNHTADVQLKPGIKYTGTANSALQTWAAGIVGDHPFTVYSDIQTTGSGTWEVDEVENARRALGGIRGSVLDTYGGEYRFDNYHIMLLAQRGQDAGIPIMYGKNLTDLEQEEEIANTYTSVYPYATFTPEGSEKEQTITLPEYYIDSSYAGNFARRKILKVDFSEEEIKTVERLRSRTQTYIEENDVGVPKVNLRVKFVDLSKTLDYKDVAPSEAIHLCDWVTVHFSKLGIKRKAKVIKTVWNPVLERYEEIEVGESRASLSESINSVIDGKVDRVEKLVNVVQISANGKARIFRQTTAPTEGMSKGDLWYQPVGDGEKMMYEYDGATWKLEKVSAGLLGGTLDAENGDVNLINVNADSISVGRFRSQILENSGVATFGSVEESISNIDIKERNLLLNSGVPYTNGRYPVSSYSLTEKIKDGEEVTILFKGKLNTQNERWGIYNSGAFVGMVYFTPDELTKDGIYKKTFNWRVGDTSNTSIWVYPMPNLGTTNSVEWIKLVRGRITSNDWSPAPEDSPTKEELATTGQTVIDGGNVTTGRIRDKNGTTDLNLDAGHFRINHSDGSYTLQNAAGFQRYVAGTNTHYHYLMHMTTFVFGESSSTARWIQLPPEFKGRQFKVYLAIADSLNAINYKRSIQRFVCAIHPDHKVDYANARVPVISYKSETLMDGASPSITDVQGLLMAVF